MRYLICFLLTLNAPLAFSQVDLKPADSNSIWQGYWIGNTNSDWLGFLTDSIVNDTIVNSQSYTKLFLASTDTQKTYFCGFRYDSLEQSIYILPKDSSSEFLFFDFDTVLTVGDVIEIAHYGKTTFMVEPCELLSIDSVNINGIYYKNWYYSGTLHPDLMIISEHFIGLYNFPFNTSSFEWWAMELECHMENNIPIIGNCPFNYEDVAHIENENLSHVKIFPNPASDALNISGLPTTHSWIKIYDSLGRLISQHQLSGTELRINLSQYHSGLYFISIETDGNLTTKKLLIE